MRLWVQRTVVAHRSWPHLLRFHVSTRLQIVESSFQDYPKIVECTKHHPRVYVIPLPATPVLIVRIVQKPMAIFRICSLKRLIEGQVCAGYVGGWILFRCNKSVGGFAFVHGINAPISIHQTPFPVPISSTRLGLVSGAKCTLLPNSCCMTTYCSVSRSFSGCVSVSERCEFGMRLRYLVGWEEVVCLRSVFDLRKSRCSISPP